MAAGSVREAELLRELQKVKQSSAKEIRELKDKLDEALQEQALLEVNLGAQRINTETVEADAAEGDSLRRTLNTVSAEKEAIEQQLQIMSTLDELKDAEYIGAQPAQAASTSHVNTGMELVKDRAALLQENERLWKELEQTKVALAVESTLRSNLLSGTSASAFHRAASIKSLPENGATDSSALDETTLLHSLRKAGKKAKSAVKRVGLHSAGTSPVKRADNGQTSLLKSAHIPRTPDEVAHHIREQVQRDRRSSVTANIVARISSHQTPPAAHEKKEASPVNTRADTPEFSYIADQALNQLHEAHAYVQAATLQEEAQARGQDPIRPAALGLTSVQPSKSPASWDTGAVARPPSLGDSSHEHRSRLAPSMPAAPSRSNTMDRSAHPPSGLNTGTSQGVDQSPGMQQVHFASYVEPHTFHVAPPATPHPSKGLLNPHHNAESRETSHHANGVDSLLKDDGEQRQQVTFAEAVSPRQHSPAAPTPHHSHGFLQRGFSGGSDLNGTVNSQQEHGPYLHSPDRSVSFKVDQSGPSEQGIDGPGAMRCLDRSPGCTPVVGGTPTARVRMHSRPGHDNFAPLKSSTASPGGTPHARGQGRLPSVRVSRVDAAGHLEFNPMRCGSASPGCTPLPSTPESDASEFGIPAAGGDRDFPEGSTSSQRGGVLGAVLGVPVDARFSPPDSQGTDRTGHMHMVVVGHGTGGLPDAGSHHLVPPGEGRTVSIVCDRNNEGFFPMNAGERSPGHTPATPGLLGWQADPHVRFISSGHDSFNPLTSNGSPGHTPHACGYSAASATAAAQGCPADASDPFGGVPLQRRVSIHTEAAPHTDTFHPLTCDARSWGHTPRISVSQGGNVTLVCTPGHDHFHPIRSDAHSAGNTPRYCPSSRSADDAAGPSARTGSSVNLHVNINAPHSHDEFNPMHNGTMSPGHTPYYPQDWPPSAGSVQADTLYNAPTAAARGSGAPVQHPLLNGSAPERPRTSRGRRPADSSDSSYLNGHANDLHSHSVDMPENRAEVWMGDSTTKNEDVGEQSNAAASQPLSDDGTSLPASVRDAAMKALQSSESVRRRLINAAEDTDAAIANKAGKRHRSARMSAHQVSEANATTASGYSTTNQQWVPGVLRSTSDGVFAPADDTEATSALDRVPSDVPKRPSLVPKRGWSAPRPATAPVFGEDTPGEFQNLYGNQELENSSKHSARASNKSSMVGGGGVSRAATGASTTAVASASEPGPGVSRSVSITEKWLSPSDRRKSRTSDSFAFSAHGRPSAHSTQSVEDVFGLPPRHPSLPDAVEIPRGTATRTCASSPARDARARDRSADRVNSAFVMQRLPIRSMRDCAHGSYSSRARSECGAPQ